MRLSCVNPSDEIIVPKFSIDGYTMKRTIEEVNSLLKDARLLALERDQYALLGIIDMIIGGFNVIAKSIEPPVCKTKQGAI